MSKEYIIDLDKMIQKFRTLSEVHTVNSESLQYAQLCAWLLELKHRRDDSTIKYTKIDLCKKTEESISVLREICSKLELNNLHRKLSDSESFIKRMIDHSSLPDTDITFNLGDGAKYSARKFDGCIKIIDKDSNSSKKENSMKCQRCDSRRIAEVSAKCKDAFAWKGDVAEHEGYVHTPSDELGSGDYIEFKYCLECGQIQDSFPVSSEWKDKNEEEDGISISQTFKEKFDVCLRKIESQNLRLKSSTRIFHASQEGLNNFIKEVDEILTEVVSICLEEGLSLDIIINKRGIEELSSVSLCHSNLSIHDYSKKESNKIISHFNFFINFMCSLCAIPAIPFSFIREVPDLQLKTVTIVVNSDT